MACYNANKLQEKKSNNEPGRNLPHDKNGHCCDLFYNLNTKDNDQSHEWKRPFINKGRVNLQ